MKPFTALAAGVFALIAFMHVLRLLFAWEVTLNGNTIPMWVSVAGMVLAGLLALMLWRENRQRQG
jgi:hypothetical protein